MNDVASPSLAVTMLKCEEISSNTSNGVSVTCCSHFELLIKAVSEQQFTIKMQFECTELILCFLKTKISVSTLTP